MTLRIIAITFLLSGIFGLAACGGSSGAVMRQASSAAGDGRLFPSAAANWLYSPPSGSPLNVSNVASRLGFGLRTHQDGFDYPVVFTRGLHGCTMFTDTLVYAYTDRICVPQPAHGFWPSTGGWGANDGHLVVVDTTTRTYYDFWKLTVDAQGRPVSTNVGAIFSGNLNGNGTPGGTAAYITGLAGDILPGELDCATCLNHALLAIVPGTMNSSGMGSQAPVFHYDGATPGAIFREGAKLRFDPAMNIAALPASTATKAILRALQLYGAVIVDQTGGGGIGFYTSLPAPPDETGMNLIGQHLWIYY